MKIVNTHMGLFDYTIRCVIGDYSEAVKYASKLFGDDISQENVTVGDAPRGCCMFRPEYVPIIWVPHYPKTPGEYATLNHECIHATFHLFEWAGIPISRDTEEVFTHSVSHVVTNILTKAQTLKEK